MIRKQCQRGGIGLQEATSTSVKTGDYETYFYRTGIGNNEAILLSMGPVLEQLLGLIGNMRSLFQGKGI